MEKTLTSIFLLAAGTYLLRVFPLLLSLKKENRIVFDKNIKELCEYIGPSLIASLFVFSITPLTRDTFSNPLPLLSGITTIVISHLRWKNPGISVLVGIAAYMGANLF